MNERHSAESLHRLILMIGALSMIIFIGLSHADRPKTPLPRGLSFGFVDSTYTFWSRVFNPEGDSSAMRFAWGDGDTSSWSSYRINRSTISDSHSWSSPGTYYIKAQAKDKHGVTLLWSRRCEIDIGYCDTLLYWRYLTGSHVWSSPAIGSDGTVYVKPMFDLYAINPDGTLKWRNSTLGIFNSPAIGSDGTIYVGSGDYRGYIQKPADVEPVKRYLYAINPDGTLKWRYSTNGVLNSAAIGSDVQMSEDVHINPRSVIGNNVTIGKNSVINASIIWNNVVIGANVTIDSSIICNNAIIPDNSKLASGTVIGPNAQFDTPIITSENEIVKENSMI